MGRCEAVALGHGVDARGGEVGEQVAQGDVEQIITQAVDPLERAEEEDQVFDVRAVKVVGETVQRVGDRVRQVLGGKVALKVKDIVAQTADVAVLGFGEIPDEEMDLAAIFGERRGDFLAQENAGQIGDF